eukprot:6203787-Pleurochrysis_carterae.AAC.5
MCRCLQACRAAATCHSRAGRRGRCGMQRGRGSAAAGQSSPPRDRRAGTARACPVGCQPPTNTFTRCGTYRHSWQTGTECSAFIDQSCFKQCVA